MGKKSLKVDEIRCVECLCCQLRCSLLYTGAFNPEKARIKIKPRIEPGEKTEISFLEECTEGCALCARYCPTGALERQYHFKKRE